MNETACSYDPWAIWLLIGLVVVCSGIVFVATWAHWDRKYKTLLREQASDDRARARQIQNVKIREATYRDVTLGDLQRGS